MKKLLAAVLSIVMSEACGGGSSTTPGSKISVSVTPSVVTIPFGAAEQFTVTVQGTTNTAVIRSVAGEGCSGGCGTIDANGLYTAPTTAPGHASLRVVATLVADNTKLQTACGWFPVSKWPSRAEEYNDHSSQSRYRGGVEPGSSVAVEGIPPFGSTVRPDHYHRDWRSCRFLTRSTGLGSKARRQLGEHMTSRMLSIQDDVNPPRLIRTRRACGLWSTRTSAECCLPLPDAQSNTTTLSRAVSHGASDGQV